jgi:hypothetical protein
MPDDRPPDKKDEPRGVLGWVIVAALLPVALCAVLLWQLVVGALVLGGTLFGAAGGRGKK